MPLLFELRDVAKRYGDRTVLDIPSLGVETGRTTVLIGPSGCGKSTVLRLFTGLIAPDAGSVTFEAAPITLESVVPLRRRIGYVIQDGGLFPHLTGRGNVRLMADHLGWPSAKTKARIDTLVELTRLPPDTLDRFPAELSGGQRQRVSLIRALMLDPDALLLDEPLGALDPMIRFDLQNDLAEIFRTLKKTVVLVTHDLSEAMFFADRVVLLREGRIVQEGPPSDLIDRPADGFVTTFIRAQRPALTMGGGQ